MLYQENFVLLNKYHSQAAWYPFYIFNPSQVPSTPLQWAHVKISKSHVEGQLDGSKMLCSSMTDKAKPDI